MRCASLVGTCRASANPESSPDDLASRLAAHLALPPTPPHLGQPPVLVPEGPMDRRFLLEGIDCLACEFAPLYGQFGCARIISWEEGKQPVIEYARGLTIRSSEIRLYLRRKKNGRAKSYRSI